MQNESGSWLYLSPDGQTVIEGDEAAAGVPNGSTILAAPGAEVPMDIVNRYKLADRLGAKARSMMTAGAETKHVIGPEATKSGVIVPPAAAAEPVKAPVSGLAGRMPAKGH